MLIIFDVDCTLLKYRDGWISYWAKNSIHPIKELSEMNHGNYTFENMYGLPRERVVEMIEEFNVSVEFGELRSFLLQSHEAGLEYYADKNKIAIVTACGQGFDTESSRECNLNSEGISYDYLMCLPLGSNKNAAIQEIMDEYPEHRPVLFFDNCLKTIKAAEGLCNTYLVDHYGLGDPGGVTTLHNFDEILEVIESFEG